MATNPNKFSYSEDPFDMITDKQSDQEIEIYNLKSIIAELRNINAEQARLITNLRFNYPINESCVVNRTLERIKELEVENFDLKLRIFYSDEIWSKEVENLKLKRSISILTINTSLAKDQDKANSAFQVCNNDEALNKKKSPSLVNDFTDSDVFKNKKKSPSLVNDYTDSDVFKNKQKRHSSNISKKILNATEVLLPKKDKDSKINSNNKNRIKIKDDIRKRNEINSNFEITYKQRIKTIISLFAPKYFYICFCSLMYTFSSLILIFLFDKFNSYSM